MSQVRLHISHDEALLLALLTDADENDARILATLRNERTTSYLILAHDTAIGAVVMEWQEEESEILYVALAAAWRGKGFGKQAMQELIALARGRTHALRVGTANSSLDNIAFYQKCGFRMVAIRPDYFSDVQPMVFEHGILMQDMLILRHTLLS